MFLKSKITLSKKLERGVGISRLRGFVYGYLKHILLKKNLKCISSENSAENRLFGRFQP